MLRSAARLILGKRKFDPISVDLRQRLHWLPVEQRIQYKLGLLVYKCLHGLALPYLSSMLTPVSSNQYSCRLRSAARGNLTVPRTRSVRMGPRSFAVSGPELWNSLAPELKNPNISLVTFKSLLETELFKRAYTQLFNSYNSFLVTLFTLGKLCFHLYFVNCTGAPVMEFR